MGRSVHARSVPRALNARRAARLPLPTDDAAKPVTTRTARGRPMFRNLGSKRTPPAERHARRVPGSRRGLRQRGRLRRPRDVHVARDRERRPPRARARVPSRRRIGGRASPHRVILRRRRRREHGRREPDSLAEPPMPTVSLSLLRSAPSLLLRRPLASHAGPARATSCGPERRDGDAEQPRHAPIRRRRADDPPDRRSDRPRNRNSALAPMVAWHAVPFVRRETRGRTRELARGPLPAEGCSARNHRGELHRRRGRGGAQWRWRLAALPFSRRASRSSPVQRTPSRLATVAERCPLRNQR